MFKYRYLYHRPETEIEAGVCLHFFSPNNLPHSKIQNVIMCFTCLREMQKPMLQTLCTTNGFSTKIALILSEVGRNDGLYHYQRKLIAIVGREGREVGQIRKLE